MGFLNVSRQRAAEPSATGSTLSVAAGFVTEGGCLAAHPALAARWGHSTGGSGRLMQHPQVPGAPQG